MAKTATPDALGPSHHEHKKKPIGRRYRQYLRMPHSLGAGCWIVTWTGRAQRHQALGADTPETRVRRSFPAILTRSAIESAFIFSMTLPRCAFTVISVMPSSLPTSLFGLPAATKAITWRSRPVSD